MRRFNWHIWAGFLLSLITLFSYPLLFVRWPVTRDLPWANLLLLALTLALVVVGVRRAFGAGRRWYSKVMGVLIALLSLTVLTSFVYGVLVVPRQLPASVGAPQVGEKAPDFRLLDVNNQPVSLSDLLSAPIRTRHSGESRAPKGVLLIFYRGYW